MRYFIFFLFFVLAFAENPILKAQNTEKLSLENFQPVFAFDSFRAQDSLIPKRVKPLAIGCAVTYTGTLLALNEFWYKEYPRSSFHFYNDFGEWRNMDKLGHIYSNYIQSYALIKMAKWSGFSTKKAVLIGGTTGIAFQSIIEILDGFSSQWGFSWADMLANATGALTAMGQEYYWQEERIQLKFSSHLQKYPSAYKERVENLYGKSAAERILKDYNAQTYWYSVNPWSFKKESNFPKWLNFSVGIGAQGMYGGWDNRWVSEDGSSHFISAPRYTQIYFSPDIDLTKINTRSKALKFFLVMLNTIKVPAPSLEYGKYGGWKLHLLYF